VGDFTTFVLLAMRLILPLFVFGMLINQIQQSEASAQRIAEIFETAPTVRDEAGSTPLAGPLERVEVRDMCFAYPGRDKVLCGINLTMERGRVLGVVGPTGAGKSSLAKLMLRYYDPAEGEILANGRSLSGVTLDSWRARIGYVSQEAYLFHGTVAENIRLGSPDSSDDALHRAAHMAGAHEFIEALPDGYDTLVGDRGMKLSGGQRQRISLARAILRDPEFLILDEATSSVDTRTEEVIQNNLKELRSDRITLAIAHRLSTVRQCDEIVVVVDGIIVERGTHAELVTAGGVYAGLWQVQSGD
jgi:ATP-binding cassette subfamily B protein